jgi:hypothetical protein
VIRIQFCSGFARLQHEMMKAPVKDANEFT